MFIVPPCGGRNHVLEAAELRGSTRYGGRPMAAPAALRPVAALAAAALLAFGGAGCGDDDSPVEVQLKEETEKQTVLGFPAVATKNTTRIGGEDPPADAAGAASAVYPGVTRGSRPRAVTLVDSGDWRAGIAAAVLAAPPLRAPILLTDGEDAAERDRRPRSTPCGRPAPVPSAGLRRSRSEGRERRTSCAGRRVAGQGPVHARRRNRRTRRPKSAGARRRTS